MSTGRFFYLVPAESRHRLPAESIGQHLWRIAFHPGLRRPTGGVKVIYQHCRMLREAGITAHVVHLGRFTVDWFDHDLQPLSVDEALRIMTPDDILVVPERIPAAAAAYPARRKLAFVQNGGLVAPAVEGGRYEDFGFTGILCCSSYLADFMAPLTALPRFTVTNGIPLDRFQPDAARRRAGSLLYLKRKTSWHLGREVLSQLPGDVRDAISVVEAPNRLTEAEMIRLYQAADMFMALGFPEGFALPPLEAMACGAAVAGFTGGGGALHMHDGQSALVAPDGDVPALVDALTRLVRDQALKEDLRSGGLAMARNFDMGTMRRELLAFAAALRPHGE